MPRASAVSTSSTMTVAPPNSMAVPAERDDENRRSSRIGKDRSMRISRITVPTWPVAPTMATESPESEMRVMMFLGVVQYCMRGFGRDVGVRMPRLAPMSGFR